MILLRTKRKLILISISLGLALGSVVIHTQVVGTIVGNTISTSSLISTTACFDTSNNDTCLSRGSSAGFLSLSSTTNSSTNTLGIKNGAAAEIGSIGWSGNNFRVGTIGGVSGGTARDTIIGSAAGAS